MMMPATGKADAKPLLRSLQHADDTFGVRNKPFLVINSFPLPPAGKITPGSALRPEPFRTLWDVWIRVSCDRTSYCYMADIEM